MNRQARLLGTNRWWDYSDVTLAEAAKQHAIAVGSMFGGDSWTIEVRDEDDGVVHQVVVRRVVSYEVSGLRGGER